MTFFVVKLLLVLTILSASVGVVQGELRPRCGDCWCIYSGDSCPTNETGVVDSFDLEEASVVNTFVLENDPDFLKLQTADGQACYPFAESVGPLENVPESDAPQCAFPESTNSSVCAFLYNPENKTCSGRQYQVLTYDSEADAIAAGAKITHDGACGVCSSAQDLWAEIKNYGKLESESIVCATTFTLSTATDRFDKFTKCYTDLGFTEPCGRLWAFSGATNAIKCATYCLPDSSGLTLLNGPAPECAFEGCLTCSMDFNADFNVIAGRTLASMGVTERIARDCDVIYRGVDRDYCAGTTALGDVPALDTSSTSSSQPPPTSASADSSEFLSVLALIVISLVF